MEMIIDDLPRVAIAHLPTPIELLPHLTAQLDGPELWARRDDHTGLATGGNKTRKLEFLVADALAQGGHTNVTCGAAQSNHARQTAVAAAKFGLARLLVLRGDASSELQGNLLLNRILDAEIVWSGEVPPHELFSVR
jgi:L-cysteate sulfo-lyase